MVMSYLGSNLESLMRRNRGKFSMQTVLMIAEQLLMRIEVLHSHKLIHRDIKPENFVVGGQSKGDTV